ncbi:hypothetical protein I6L80_21500 (plasmid) [Providencia rettgeri]|uniref:hypothetical protein n=1 Tax=Providencia rettgeri TaxID=587 RepID=UPI001C24C3A1|nr:hypothetical protein [Providencia rettgeri]MCG5369584.1 hypothetical protein [Providencia rettgeri]QXB07873.1 hypothetical protein I6L80_21500 [Providencia rettgeri]
MLTWRWENKYRWYEAELCFDLFGDLLLIQRWGGLGNNLHGQKTELVADFLSGVAMLFKIDQERKRRKPPYFRV